MSRKHFWWLLLLADACLYFFLLVGSVNLEDKYNNDLGLYLSDTRISWVEKVLPLALMAWYVVHGVLVVLMIRVRGRAWVAYLRVFLKKFR